MSCNDDDDDDDDDDDEDEKANLILPQQIQLKDVPIVTPSGDVLVKSLSLELRPG